MIKDRLDKECAVREAQDESLMFQSAQLRTAHEMRFESWNLSRVTQAAPSEQTTGLRAGTT